MKNKLERIVKIEGSKWEEAYKNAFNKENSKAKIDGFRAGKAPLETYLKKYGEQAILLSAADAVLQDAYTKMLDELGDVELVAAPDVNLKSVDKKFVEFTFSLTTRPEVKLKKYKGLDVKAETVKVTAKEVDEAIKQMRSKYSENAVKEGAIVSGDIVVFDYEGFVNDVAFDGGKADNYSLEIGSNTFIPGFEDQMIGLKAGDKSDVKVTFPTEYHSEDLAGKEAIFKVLVHEVKEVVIPEINEEFFEDLAMEGVTDLATLKIQVKENIKVSKEKEAEDKYIDSLLEAVIEQMEVEVPDEMTNEETDRMIKQYTENLKMQGLTLEQFYQFTNSDEAALKGQMTAEALKRVKSRLLLEEVRKLEKLEVSEKDVTTESETLAKKYNMEKDEFLKLFGGEEMVKYDLEMRKSIEFLKENN